MLLLALLAARGGDVGGVPLGVVGLGAGYAASRGVPIIDSMTSHYLGTCNAVTATISGSSILSIVAVSASAFDIFSLHEVVV
jgi:hypothetical protein